MHTYYSTTRSKFVCRCKMNKGFTRNGNYFSLRLLIARLLKVDTELTPCDVVTHIKIMPFVD